MPTAHDVCTPRLVAALCLAAVVAHPIAMLSSPLAAMEPRNHVAVSATSTTAPVSTTQSSAVVVPSAAMRLLDSEGLTPAHDSMTIGFRVSRHAQDCIL
jgi:hypothetical protein